MLNVAQPPIVGLLENKVEVLWKTAFWAYFKAISKNVSGGKTFEIRTLIVALRSVRFLRLTTSFNCPVLRDSMANRVALCPIMNI
jgi:hypothetical protein